MYKEMLEALLEGLTPPVEFKKTLLENQLKYHFANKNEENIDIQNDSARIVSRILDKLIINELIGIQTLSLKNPKVISSGIEYDVEPDTIPFRARWTLEAMEDFKSGNGDDLKAVLDSIDIHRELLQAMANEIRYGITAEILGKINQVTSYTGAIYVDFTGLDILKQAELIKLTIISHVREVDGNWIVISPLILSMLQSCNDSEFKPTTKSNFEDSSLSCVGMLDENIKVYMYMFQDEDTVLIGSKVEDREDTPIIYAPETLLMPNETAEPNGFGTMWGFMARYKLFVEPAAAEAIYRKISIKT